MGQSLAGCRPAAAIALLLAGPALATEAEPGDILLTGIRLPVAITNTMQRPAYALVNLNASHALDRVRFDATLSNALDELYFLTPTNLQANAG
jgi:hypothetical protein